MNPISKLAVAVTAAIMIVGCGGSSASKTPTQTANLSRDVVRDLLKMGLDNSANIRGGGNENQAPTQSRTKAYGPKSVSRLAKKGPVAQRGITREGEGDEWFQYSEWLGLWELSVMASIDDPSSGGGFKYFVDEAKTQPAGHDLTWTSDGLTYPYWSRTEQTLTAGNFAGEWHKTYNEFFENGNGTVEGSGNIPNYGTYTYSGGWNDGGMGDWNERFEAVDGSWQTYNWKTTLDSEVFTLNSSNGLKLVLVYNHDFTGTGTITGPSSLLPAQLVWNETGAGTITWADGTTTEFSDWNFFNW